MSDKYAPERGDIVWLNLSPQAGHEQAGKRPALVLSPKQYNSRTGLAVVCPVTNQKKDYPFEVELRQAKSITGVILSDQVKSLDWKVRQATFADKAPEAVVHECTRKIKALLMIR